MARKGESIITRDELHSRLSLLEKKINSILSFLVFIEAVETKNFLIQGATDEFAGAGTSIDFPIAFKSGTVPLVLITSQNKECVVGRNAAPTETAFTGYGRYISDGSSATCFATWIAIGERG